MVAGSVRLGTRRGPSAAEVDTAIAEAMAALELWPHPITAIHGGSAAAWPAANQGIYCKFQLAAEHVATGIGIGVGAASGNAKAGLYTSDGTTVTQVAMSASTAVAGSNARQRIPFVAPVAVGPSVVYFGFLVLDNATVTIMRLTMLSGSVAGDIELTYAQNTVFTTPKTTELITNLSAGPSGGYTPSMWLY